MTFAPSLAAFKTVSNDGADVKSVAGCPMLAPETAKDRLPTGRGRTILSDEYPEDTHFQHNYG